MQLEGGSAGSTELKREHKHLNGEREGRTRWYGLGERVGGKVCVHNIYTTSKVRHLHSFSPAVNNFPCLWIQLRHSRFWDGITCSGEDIVLIERTATRKHLLEKVF